MTTNESKECTTFEEMLAFFENSFGRVPTIDSRARNKEVFDAATKAIHNIVKQKDEKTRGLMAAALQYMVIQYFNTVNARIPAPLGEILGEK